MSDLVGCISLGLLCAVCYVMGLSVGEYLAIGAIQMLSNFAFGLATR